MKSLPYIVGVYLINPIVGTMFALIGLYKDRKRSVYYSCMIAGLFSALAYWFIPSHEMDLTRYFEQLQKYSNMPWEFFVETVLSKQILFIQEIFFYLVAQTNNFHLLPAIVVYIVYFITIYMITDYANRNKVESKNMMRSLIFILCIFPFPSIVSNVRNILAFAIFTFAVYRDLVQKKKNIITYILYICPVFIHISTVALLLMRLVLIIYKKSKKIVLVICGCVIGGPFIVNAISPYLVFSNKVLSAFFNKSVSYINTTDSAYAIYLQNSLFMRLQKLYFIGVVIFLLIIIILSNFQPRKRSFYKEQIYHNKDILMFYKLISCLVIGTIPIIITVYMRFTFVVIMLSFIVVMEIKKYINIKLYRQLIYIGVFVAAVGGLIHQMMFMSQMTSIINMVTNVLIRTMFNMYIM